MDLKTAADILERHNRWRREGDDCGEAMQNPTLIGEAIDAMVARFRAVTDVADKERGFIRETLAMLPPDDFRNDNFHLIACIEALLSLDKAGALVPHGVGGHARGLLASAAHRLAAYTTPQPQGDAVTVKDMCDALDRIPLSERKPAAPLEVWPATSQDDQLVAHWRQVSAVGDGHDVIANRNTVRRLIQHIDAIAATPQVSGGGEMVRLRQHIAGMPTRTEYVGGQREVYIQRGEVLDWFDAALSAQPRLECRNLTDRDMDRIIEWIERRDGGAIGWHEFCDNIIREFSQPASAPVGVEVDANARHLLAHEYCVKLGTERGAKVLSGPWTMEEDAALRAISFALAQQPAASARVFRGLTELERSGYNEQPAAVDEAMLYRAEAAALAVNHNKEPWFAMTGRRLRAALEAALAQPQGEE